MDTQYYMNLYIDSLAYERQDIRTNAQTNLSPSDYQDFIDLADTLDKLFLYKQQKKHESYIKKLITFRNEQLNPQSVVNFRTDNADVPEETREKIEDLFKTNFNDDNE